MITNPWIWIYIGIGLMFLELIVSGFILCFFGLAAATVGVIRFIIGDAFDLTWELAAFSGLSVAYIFLLRRWFKRTFVGDKKGDADLGDDNIGRVGKVTAAIKPPLAGRVMLGDSEWSAEADVPVAIGANVRVISQNNLTIKVEVI